MEKVKALQNMAYRLGVEEGALQKICPVQVLIRYYAAREMSRGKCLDVFQLPDSSESRRN